MTTIFLGRTDDQLRPIAASTNARDVEHDPVGMIHAKEGKAPRFYPAPDASLNRAELLDIALLLDRETARWQMLNPHHNPHEPC